MVRVAEGIVRPQEKREEDMLSWERGDQKRPQGKMRAF